MKKRRGIVNKANEEVIREIKKKKKSPKKLKKLTLNEDYALKEHHI